MKMKEEEFYEQVERKREEVRMMDISETEKGRLYQIIEEGIQRYEETKKACDESRKYISELRNNLAGLLTNYYNMMKKCEELNENVQFLKRAAGEIKKELPKLERTLKEAIAIKIVRENPEIMN